MTAIYKFPENMSKSLQWEMYKQFQTRNFQADIMNNRVNATEKPLTITVKPIIQAAPNSQT